MPRFRELSVWKKAHALTLAMYEATADFPRDELYGLTSQLRRASSSIPSNIAEGSGRGTDREMARSLRIALGSSNELEYQLLLAHDLGFLPDKVYANVTDRALELQRMLASFIHRFDHGQEANSF